MSGRTKQAKAQAQLTENAKDSFEGIELIGYLD